VPFAIDKYAMKTMASKFSKGIFWLENTLYFIALGVYEIILLPFIYIKVIYNIIRVASPIKKVPFITFWLIIGPFFLIYGLFNDLLNLLRILWDYHEEENRLEA